VDWPPAQNADDSGSSKADSGGSDTASTPIVMPDGQIAQSTHPGPVAPTNTSTPPTPIVPVGATP
jgi:hypothetical protein